MQTSWCELANKDVIRLLEISQSTITPEIKVGEAVMSECLIGSTC